LHSGNAQSQIYFNQAIRKEGKFTIQDTILKPFVNDIFRDYASMKNQVLKQAPRKVQRDINQISIMTGRGDLSFNDAMKLVMGRTAPDYLKFKDKNGTNLDTYGYLNTAFRTNLAEFNQEQLKTEMEQYDEDLVITDVLADGCEKCAP